MIFKPCRVTNSTLCRYLHVKIIDVSLLLNFYNWSVSSFINPAVIDLAVSRAAVFLIMDISKCNGLCVQ